MTPENFLQITCPLPEAMYLLSGEAVILAVNPAAARMLEQTADALIGKRLVELVHDAQQNVENYLHNCARSREFLPGALHWRSTGDASIDCHCHAALVQPGADKASRFILLRCKLKEDAQNRFEMLNKELESLRVKHRNLRKEKENLDQRIAERTATLTEYATRLERVNKELDQFAYVTSHDLKAPLRAISNLSKWIEEDIGETLTDETRQQMTLLRGRVHRMEALIEGILEYSRVGRISHKPETVDVAILLSEVLDSLAPPPGFTIDIDPAMPTLQAAYISLSQVFANLISNAIKYHDRADGHVVVSVREVGTDYYEFSVKDDGPGIDAQYHEKVFMIFQTLQARDKVESTGVGLTVVKKIIEDQGGHIMIESEPGQGADFRFTWPKLVVQSEQRKAG